MSHNLKSRVISVRIDHGALEVLEWEAARTGIPLRSTIRDELEAKAEEISSRYRNLNYEKQPPPDSD
jgi:hypothetical protein